MNHPEIFQVAGGKKHLERGKQFKRYFCGTGWRSDDTYEGRLLTELEFDETFCQRCVKSFWAQEARNGKDN